MTACWKPSPRDVCRKGMVHFYNITKFMSVQSSSWQVLSISRAQRKVCLFLKAIKAHVITLPESVTAVGERHQEPEHGCWWHTDLHAWRHQTRASCGRADCDSTMPPTSMRWSRSSPGGTCIFPNHWQHHPDALQATLNTGVLPAPLAVQGTSHRHTPDPEAGRSQKTRRWGPAGEPMWAVR